MSTGQEERRKDTLPIWVVGAWISIRRRRMVGSCPPLLYVFSGYHCSSSLQLSLASASEREKLIGHTSREGEAPFSDISFLEQCQYFPPSSLMLVEEPFLGQVKHLNQLQFPDHYIY